MVFDPRQFKQKKKRAVDPDAPPRPNLMSHDKTIREQRDAFTALEDKVIRQAEELARLRTDYTNMQQSINSIINILRRNK